MVADDQATSQVPDAWVRRRRVFLLTVPMPAIGIRSVTGSRAEPPEGQGSLPGARLPRAKVGQRGRIDEVKSAGGLATRARMAGQS